MHLFTTLGTGERVIHGVLEHWFITEHRNQWYLLKNMIEKTVEKAREVFTTFFHASTRNDTVYLVKKVPPATHNGLGCRLM